MSTGRRPGLVPALDRQRHSSPLPVTVLAGFDRQAVDDVGTGLLLHQSRLAMVWADPLTAELGWIQIRVSDSDGRSTERMLELEHGCLSCAMREGVLAAVRGLARTGRYDALLVHLHPGVEPDAAVESLDAGLTGTARVDSVVTVLPSDWFDELAGEATATERGIAVTSGDDRSVAVILAAGIEAATTLVLGSPGNLAPRPEEHAALAVLAPDAVRILPATPLDIRPELVLGTGGYRAERHARFARRGLLDPQLDLPDQPGELRLVRWQADRPLHPARFYEAIDGLAPGVIRSLGHITLATRPDLVVGWESAGDCLQLGPAGTLCAADTSVGSRPGLLAFLGDDLDEPHLRGMLDDCVLTDVEFAGGPECWARLEDPFPDWSDADPGEFDPVTDPTREQGAA